MLRPTAICLFILFIAFSVAANAATIYASTDKRTSLLELYTSEGCSSCPPADRWLSKLKKDKRLWKEFIPVAFHVDYWNYIGWEDRFSSAEYSERQRNYARTKNLKTVYTPGFLLNGEEWRSFFGLRKLSPDMSELVGTLTINVDKQKLDATYVPMHLKNTKLKLNIAVLGFDLVTEVRAGENRGKQLKHDFVILGYGNIVMDSSEQGYIISSDFPDVSITAPRSGIVAWVSEGEEQTPIQVVGGWFEENN
jgi:hypothetical protein